MESYNKLLKKYQYDLPEKFIAKAPVSPRDAARILIYDRQQGSIQEDIFKNLQEYLPPRALLVLNDTKVLPARLLAKKTTGGAVEIFYLATEKDGPARHAMQGMAGGRIRTMLGGKVAVGDNLYITKNISFQVLEKDGKYAMLKASFPLSKLFSVLEKYGKTPIPPYIKNTRLSEARIRKEYQTVFARQKGSVAAPTASLHFTKNLLARLKHAGISIEYITLHVNLGTFAPLTPEHIQSGKLHEEYLEISSKTAQSINKARQQNRPIIAVGTTVVRALESVVRNKKVVAGKHTTRIFIREGYDFQVVGGLITNFHVPGSSLMMLVAALIGRDKLLELYEYAKKNRFRFFSFGDGMLII